MSKVERERERILKIKSNLKAGITRPSIGKPLYGIMPLYGIDKIQPLYGIMPIKRIDD